MDLVDEYEAAVDEAELVLGVDEDESAPGGHLLSAGEESQGHLLDLLPELGGGEAGTDDLVGGDVEVVTLVGLGGGGYDGVGELLVLAQAFGQWHAADGACSGGVLAPGGSGQVAAHYDFELEGPGEQADGGHGVGHGLLPVGDDVGCGVEEVGGDLVEDLSLAGDAPGQDDVEGGDAVGGDHDDAAVGEGVGVAHLAVVLGHLAGQAECCFCQWHCYMYFSPKRRPTSLTICFTFCSWSMG